MELHHAPEKVWRALTDPALLAEWLLPIVEGKLELGAAFTFKTQPYPGWDGTVNCRVLEIDAHRTLSYTWGAIGLDTVVTFTLAPTGTPADLVAARSTLTGEHLAAYVGSSSKAASAGVPAPLLTSSKRRSR